MNSGQALNRKFVQNPSVDWGCRPDSEMQCEEKRKCNNGGYDYSMIIGLLLLGLLVAVVVFSYGAWNQADKAQRFAYNNEDYLFKYHDHRTRARHVCQPLQHLLNDFSTPLATYVSFVFETELTAQEHLNACLNITGVDMVPFPDIHDMTAPPTNASEPVDPQAHCPRIFTVSQLPQICLRQDIPIFVEMTCACIEEEAQF